VQLRRSRVFLLRRMLSLANATAHDTCGDKPVETGENSQKTAAQPYKNRVCACG
jgi:hypothetical protein